MTINKGTVGPSTKNVSAIKQHDIPVGVPKSRTIAWHELPEWQRDNHFILTGYRPASGSFKQSFASLIYQHNESFNAWSHLLGAVIFSAIAIVILCKCLIQVGLDDVLNEDLYVFACFFLGAVGCLGMSGVYHTLSNCSESVAAFGNKLDYLGIVLLIWGSFIPSIFYGFACAPELISTYWAMITTIGAGCGIVSTVSAFRSPKWRPFRASMFVLMGLSSIFPVLHGIKKYGLSELNDSFGLSWLVLQGILYITGAALYAARIPERFKPGYFDIWGSSHQIFHVLVLLAASAHLIGLAKAYDYKHSIPLSSRCLRT